MAVIGLDLGGTKLAAAVFSGTGRQLMKSTTTLAGREGKQVGKLITAQILQLLSTDLPQEEKITGIGVSVPGIYYAKSGTVWAPNIPGWENYPLLNEIVESIQRNDIKVRIDSDRACYILGETWVGTAKGCKDAIFLAVGTGIGAGIMIDGRILRGHSDIAGAIGWLALQKPFRQEYVSCGCFEYHSSGEGIAKVARELMANDPSYEGILRTKNEQQLTAHDVFAAYDNHDPLAEKVLQQSIEFWGMAVANLVSLFNPEMIVFGGGVFGPAAQFLDRIKQEAAKWAQPISFPQVTLTVSSLGGDAGLYGAARLALLATDQNS